MVENPQVPRLRWRCRRGMKELDLLLERYLSLDFPTASSCDRQAFARFLELPDPELAAYLLGGVVPADSDLARLAGQLARTRS